MHKTKIKNKDRQSCLSFFAKCDIIINMIIGFIVAIVSIVLDQLTKFLIYGTAAKSIIGNFLWFESTLNTGVAFSLFEGFPVIFIIISSIASVLIGCLIISKKYCKGKVTKISLGLILGGTFSNLLDRIMFGGVRDFIYLKSINYAIFNVADMAVVCGVILLCISLIISIIRETKTIKRKVKKVQMMKLNSTIIVKDLPEKTRLDIFLATETDWTRSGIKQQIDGGNALVNGKKQKAGYLVKDGDEITLSFEKPEMSAKPEAIPLNIVYEDEDYAIINKPQGMVVHPAPGAYNHTLVNALLYHFDKLSSGSDNIRPGIVHRIDKDTSGLLVVAKTMFLMQA